MPCLTPYRGDTAQLLLFKIASCLEASGGSVTAAEIIAALGCTPACEGDVVNSFNGQVGDVVLTLADISTLADGRYVLKAGDTMTGSLAMPDGTAALPALTFSGDTDTGTYRIGANSLGQSAGGSLILATSTTGINLTDALAYQYNGLNVIRAQTALLNYFFGPSGNLTMTGTQNVSVGLNAFVSNTAGSANTALGAGSMATNTTGGQNSAVGNASLSGNTIGSNNSAFGYLALLVNVDGSSNMAIGVAALRDNVSGSENVAIGTNALILSLGGNNTGSGFEVLADLTTGGSNTAIGSSTGLGITTGSSNTILGANVVGLPAALSNNIILADGAGVIRIQVASTGVVSIPVALTLGAAAPLSMTSGANQRAGDAVLVAGTVTVANTTVTANTRVFTSRRVAGGALGNLTYTVTAGVGFTINSDSGTDTSTVSYLLIEVP